MTYYLGIDIGSTKTAALIADKNGKPIGAGQSGPGNHETVGFDGMEKSMREALDEALKNASLTRDQITGAGFGIAGYDWHAEELEMHQTIDSLKIKAPYKMVNDVVLGLLAGTSEGWGVAVVSGTGCNCRGWDKEHNNEGRVTGYGLLMGEGAGGSELMQMTMLTLSHSWTKRLPATIITDIFMEKVGAKNFEDLIQGYTQGYYKIEPSFAPLVFEAARKGDEVAQGLIDWAGRELGGMAVGVIRQLGFEDIEFEVALIGSMFKGGEILINPMRKTIHAVAPKAKLIPVEVKPVVGAVLLGMEAGGLNLTNQERTAIKAALA